MTLNGGVVRLSGQPGGAAFASFVNSQTATAINASGIGHKFQNVKFTNTTAMTANGVFGGGAIYAGINTANTSITKARNIFDFTNVSFYNNTGTEGGAILGTAGSEFNFSGFNYIGGTEQDTGNFAVSNGGGIHLTNRSYNLQAAQPGIDAILNSTGHIIFENNHANDRGGAIFAHGATINLENARFINNRASAGGGIFIEPLVNVSNVLKSGILNIKQTDIHRDGLFIGNHGGAIAYTNRVEITFDTDADTNIRVYDDIWNTGQYFGDSSFTKKAKGIFILAATLKCKIQIF